MKTLDEKQGFIPLNKNEMKHIQGGITLDSKVVTNDCPKHGLNDSECLQACVIWDDDKILASGVCKSNGRICYCEQT